MYNLLNDTEDGPYSDIDDKEEIVQESSDHSSSDSLDSDELTSSEMDDSDSDEEA
jgi:hypothetical protein